MKSLGTALQGMISEADGRRPDVLASTSFNRAELAFHAKFLPVDTYLIQVKFSHPLLGANVLYVR